MLDSNYMRIATPIHLVQNNMQAGTFPHNQTARYQMSVEQSIKKNGSFCLSKALLSMY
jgi:hypothetical protein